MAAASTSGAPPRIPVLDGVRGLAVLLVVGYHTLGVARTDPVATVVSSLHGTMWAGVDLFFVLSGFLITGILLDSRTDAPRRYFGRFYLARTLRIFPLYYATIAALLVDVPVAASLLDVAVPDSVQTLREHQLWLWTYLQNWYQAAEPHRLPGLGHFWSLAIEEQFYLVWPVVVLAVSRRWFLRFCIAVVVACLALRIGLVLAGVDGWTVRHLTVARIDTLVLGGALAAAHREPALRERVARAAPVAGLVAVAVLVGLFAIDGRSSYDRFDAVVTLGFTCTAIASAALIAWSLTHPLLGRPSLRLLGKYSYAVYVVHPPVAEAARHVLRPIIPHDATSVPLGAAVFVTTLAASLAIAAVSWWAWEGRWLRLKDRLVHGRAPEAAAAAVPAP